MKTVKIAPVSHAEVNGATYKAFTDAYPQLCETGEALTVIVFEDTATRPAQPKTWSYAVIFTPTGREKEGMKLFAADFRWGVTEEITSGGETIKRPIDQKTTAEELGDTVSFLIHPANPEWGLSQTQEHNYRMRSRLGESLTHLDNARDF